MAECCEHGNENSNFMQAGHFVFWSA